MIWPLFRFLGRNLSNFFTVFFGKLKISKSHSEIKWPLVVLHWNFLARLSRNSKNNGLKTSLNQFSKADNFKNSLLSYCIYCGGKENISSSQHVCVCQNRCVLPTTSNEILSRFCKSWLFHTHLSLFYIVYVFTDFYAKFGFKTKVEKGCQNEHEQSKRKILSGILPP